MFYPNVVFRKNIKKDFETLRAFVKDAEYDNGRNLDWAVFKKYPHLKIFFKKNKNYKIIDKKSLHNFMHKIYSDEQERMSRVLLKYKKNWCKIASYYFFLVDKLFKNYKWPKGKYIAFSTIWGMYPRFLKDKTFQVPYKANKIKYVNVVIAHEMLHFIFYDYFYKKYPKYKLNKYNFFVWHISEIFNTVIQNSPVWIDLFKLKSIGYPEHKKIVSKITRVLYRSNTQNLNIDILIDKIIKEVKKLNLLS